MTSKADIKFQLDRMSKKLQETREDANFTKGPVNDALKVVIPMMEDQLALMRDILEFASSSPEQRRTTKDQ